MEKNLEELCPCKSGKKYGECCAAIIAGTRKAETAEELMRARYSAYAVCAVDFLKASAVKKIQDEFDPAGVKSWSEGSVWHGLEIISTERGQKGDAVGTIEFRALYSAGGKFCNHHERATFVQDDDGWKFEDGDFVAETPIVREEPRIGRNDPCPCGSGKKYKKCCGKGK